MQILERSDQRVPHGLAVLDLAADGVAVIAFVSVQNIAGRHPYQKFCNS
jgi:hypothetical protein